MEFPFLRTGPIVEELNAVFVSIVSETDPVLLAEINADIPYALVDACPGCLRPRFRDGNGTCASSTTRSTWRP